MIHHYMTKYRDEVNRLHYVSWIQMNVFRWSFTLSKREYIDGMQKAHICVRDACFITTCVPSRCLALK